MPKGFPPITLYELDYAERAGNVLLASGPRNVYFRRTLVPSDKQVGIGSCFSTLDRNDVLIEYVAELAEVPRAQAAGLLRGNTRIIYSGADDLRRSMDLALEAQRSGIRELMEMIEKNSKLRASGVHLSIVPEVVDARGNKTQSLPHAAPLEFDLP